MRILHTMLRVTDLDRSLHFYTKVLGMSLLRSKEYPEGRFTLAFLGYADESTATALELTYNWDAPKYALGDGFGHIAIEVEDVYTACARIKDKGGEIVREPGEMKHGKTVLAFIKDPDGYLIELLGKKI